MQFFNAKQIAAMAAKGKKETMAKIAIEKAITQRIEELRQQEIERKRAKKEAKKARRLKKADKIRIQKKQEKLRKKAENAEYCRGRAEENKRILEIKKAAAELEARSRSSTSSGSIPLSAMYRCGRK